MEPVNTLLVLLLVSPLVVSDDVLPCPEGLSEEVVNGVVLENGTLLADNGLKYPDGDYWRTTTADNREVYRGCVCKQKTCLRKCCPHGHIYVDGSKRGICSPQLNNTDIYDKYSKNFHLLIGVTCSEKYVIFQQEEYLIHDNGTLSHHTDIFAADQYCVEVYKNGSTADILPFPCFPEDDGEIQSAIFLLYPIGMLISEPFLLATFLVYALIPELRNLHGKSLMSQTTALFVAYFFLAVVQLSGEQNNLEFCISAAFVIYFSFLASFFWMNIMCFDMWWTFSGFRRSRSTGKKLERKKFLIYSLYAWGCPLVLLIICIVMQFGEFPESYITPQFGVISCWFADQKAIFVYFYAPVAVIVVANIIMFITTALKILQLKRETAMLKNSESKRHDDEGNKERFSLYLKLFVVMGVNWGMELISWVAGGPEYLWYISDLGNTLQGVLIFFIFVWKDKIKRLLVRRFRGTDATSSSYKSSTRISHTRNSTTRTTSMNSTYLVETTNMNPLVLIEKHEA